MIFCIKSIDKVEMKSLLYTFLIITMAWMFVSCEQNIDSTEIITVKSDPQLVSSSVLKGTVQDVDGFGIPNSDVFIYHQQLTHHIVTDAEGYYSVTFPKDSEHVHLSATANNYHSSSFDIVQLDHDEITKNFTLADADDLPYEITNTVELVDSMYAITGQILYADETPQSDAIVYLFDPSEGFLFSYTKTDEQGNFSFAYEPFMDRSLILMNACKELELIGPISVVDDHVDIGTFISSSLPTETLVIAGTVIDCNTSEGLGFGEVTVMIDGSTVHGEIENGFFTVEVPDCNGVDCYDIHIESPTLTDAIIYESCKPLSEDQNANEYYELCGNPVAYTGMIELNYDNTTQQFLVEAIDFTAEFTDLIIKGQTEDYQETIEIGIPIFGGGEINLVKYFRYAHMEMLILGHEESTGMIVDYLMEDNMITGEFSGPTLDASGTSKEVEGNFQIEIQ